LSFSSANHAAQFFGQTLATAASSVPTPASNARLSSFDKIVAESHDLKKIGEKERVHGPSYFGKVARPRFSLSRVLFTAAYLLFPGLCRQAFRNARYID
jgi:hypothetical protein